MFQYAETLAEVLEHPQLTEEYERTLRSYQLVNHTWKSQILMSLQTNIWGRRAAELRATATKWIQDQTAFCVTAPGSDEGIDQVLDYMRQFAADPEVAMAGVQFLGLMHQPRKTGEIRRKVTDPQTRTQLELVLQIMCRHGYQRSPWDLRPQASPPIPGTEEDERGGRILKCLNLMEALTHSVGWRSAMDATPTSQAPRTRVIRLVETWVASDPSSYISTARPPGRRRPRRAFWCPAGIFCTRVGGPFRDRGLYVCTDYWIH